jgi:hypothetical protein
MAGFKHKALIAIRTFHEILVAHFQIDLGMTQCAATAVAGDAGVIGFDDFGGLDGHGKIPDWRDGGDHTS